MAASTVPNLVVSQRVLDKMALAARDFLADETGEALVGLVVPAKTGTTLYVLETISPDDSAVRARHTFQQGDERQDEIIWWLQENWRHYRKLRRNSYGSALQAKWDVPLRYLGDWHKQPGFMIAPSSGDLMTALDWIDDQENDMDFLLVPIVTLGHPSTTAAGTSGVNFIAVPQDDETSMRVDFWYIDGKTRKFLPLAPAVYPADQLPGLPKYPWHLVDAARSDDELRRIQQDDLFVTSVLWSAESTPPLEVCFLTARVGADKMLIIVTPWDYPEKPPSARVAPFVAAEGHFALFKAAWEQSEPLADPQDWDWTPEKYLIDYIHALEAGLGIGKQAAETASDNATVEESAGESP